MTDRVLAELRSEQHRDWDSALSAAFGLFVVAFRDEPGFASLRYGDVLDLRPTTEVPAYSVLATQMFDTLVARFAVPATDQARAAFEASVIASDAIAAHAFVLDPKGSQTFTVTWEAFTCPAGSSVSAYNFSVINGTFNASAGTTYQSPTAPRSLQVTADPNVQPGSLILVTYTAQCGDRESGTSGEGKAPIPSSTPSPSPSATASR